MSERDQQLSTAVAEIKVRGYHLDLYGHVNNARYLELLEEARWRLLDDGPAFDRWSNRGLAFNVVNININYRRPATLGQVLLIRTSVEKIGGKSATLSQVVSVKEDDSVVADALVTFVMVDMKTGRPVPIEGEIESELTASLKR